VRYGSSEEMIVFESRKAHLDFWNELVVMREGLKKGSGRVAHC
jgi:hypothetical protein